MINLPRIPLGRCKAQQLAKPKIQASTSYQDGTYSTLIKSANRTLVFASSYDLAWQPSLVLFSRQIEKVYPGCIKDSYITFRLSPSAEADLLQRSLVERMSVEQYSKWYFDRLLFDLNYARDEVDLTFEGCPFRCLKELLLYEEGQSSAEDNCGQAISHPGIIRSGMASHNQDGTISCSAKQPEKLSTSGSEPITMAQFCSQTRGLYAAINHVTEHVASIGAHHIVYEPLVLQSPVSEQLPPASSMHPSRMELVREEDEPTSTEAGSSLRTTTVSRLVHKQAVSTSKDVALLSSEGDTITSQRQPIMKSYASMLSGSQNRTTGSEAGMRHHGFTPPV